jgi:[2-(trimethylamino)ethyl]phosphonate dioxygenase
MSVTLPGLLLEIQDGGLTLVVSCSGQPPLRFSALWLRDNNPTDRGPGNGQKLTNITDLILDSRIISAEIPTEGRLAVVFSPDNAHASFDPGLLLGTREQPSGDQRTWTKRDFPAGPPSSRWLDVSNDASALKSWLSTIRDHGVAVLTGLPDQPGMVLQVSDLFGYVRETNYGRLFDVKAEVDPINLAFTGLALSVHTDNPYRDPVPGIQLLHCLENAAEGGDTVLVDGFGAAWRLREEDREAFEILARTWVTFSYRSGDTALTARRPMISLDDRGRVIGIYFNNRSLAPLNLLQGEISAFYQAYHRFANILFDPDGALTFKLGSGELFAVDNKRVLHGRTAFFAAGKRHLQGCYVDMDGLLSRLSVLER